MRLQYFTLAAVIVVISILSFVYFINLPQEQYGYWKVNKTADLAEVKAFADRNIPTWTTDVDYSDISIQRSFYNNKSDIVIHKTEDVRGVLKDKFFIALHDKDLDIIRVDEDRDNSKVKTVIFEQKYNNIPFCEINTVWERTTYVHVSNDKIVAVISTYYPNLTAPTRPKLTDEQIGKIVGAPPGWLQNIKSSLCIFPKWHSEGEYWTYHLAKNYDGLIIDSWTGELLFEPKAIIE